MARSVRSFIDELSIAVRDTAGSRPLWTFGEKYQAIQNAFDKAKGYFPYPAVYESLTLVPGIGVYALPQYVKDIRLVEYGPLATRFSGQPEVWNPITHYRQVQTQYTNLLYLHGSARLDEGPMRIHHDRDLQSIPVEATFSIGPITATQNYIPVAQSNGDFRRQWVPLLPTHLQIGEEVIRVEAVTATSFTGIYRGALNTSPRFNSLANGIGLLHSTLGALTPYIVEDAADEFIAAQAKRELFLIRMVNAPAEDARNVALLAAEYGREAEAQKTRYSPPASPRTMTFRHPPRR